MKDFRKLMVRKKAHELTLAVMYQATRDFPRDEIYGLTSQMPRSCASIPANLAEGCGRGSDADFARFCSIAIGSASEEDHLLLARDLKMISPATHDELSGKSYGAETHAQQAYPKVEVTRAES